ncbi:hypothetical protein [Cereibacter sphaeroides]|uniref:hypothetical protein n=1 Tax=Cereibacter sphaeroides TaxID=1063 RepID=UPI001F3D7FCA|nr:hypothetical protein [Cereibacter sphaeroides]MCE6966996.1 hypothetical protein [Cereibacter sphaeroides]
MQFIRGGVARPSHRLLLSLMAVASLTGCSETDLPVISVAMPAAETEYRLVSNQRRWVGIPAGDAALERMTATGPEQLIGLPNPTTTPGDNFILIKARKDHAAAGRFSTSIFAGDMDERIRPFRRLTEDSLRSREDPLGSLFWTELRQGGLYCVLAFRRANAAARMLPANAHTVDLMMRNCVNGDLEAALAPIGAASIAGGPTGSGGAGIMLSPLAGPQP